MRYLTTEHPDLVYLMQLASSSMIKQNTLQTGAQFGMSVNHLLPGTHLSQQLLINKSCQYFQKLQDHQPLIDFKEKEKSKDLGHIDGFTFSKKLSLAPSKNTKSNREEEKENDKMMSSGEVKGLFKQPLEYMLEHLGEE